MAELRVLVIGGGIAGLTAGAALSQAGHDVRVVEANPDLESSVLGVGVVQQSNALRALDRIGCADACMEAGWRSTGAARLLDGDGEIIGESRADMSVDRKRFPLMNGITRPNLHQILMGRLAELGGRLDYSTTFSSIEDHGDAVAVSLSDGSSGDFDLVVGADGIRSAVRAAVFGEDIQPQQIEGLASCRQNIPRVIPGEIEIDRGMIQRLGTRDVGYNPISADEAYVWCSADHEPGHRVTPEEAAQQMRDFMEGFGGITGRVRDQYIEPEKVLYRPLELLLLDLPWHRGRVVLVGDAVHGVTPHLGQGAGLAVEDGVVLAEEIGRHESIEGDLIAYGERRYDRAEVVYEACRTICEWERNPTDDTKTAMIDLRNRATERLLLEL